MSAGRASLTCSTREAASLIGVNVRTIRLWVEDGRLAAWKTPGGHRRILVESVERPHPMAVVVLLATSAERAAVRARLPEGVVLVDPPFDGSELAALVWGLWRARRPASERLSWALPEALRRITSRD